MSERRFAQERRRLEAMLEEGLPIHIATGALVAQQTLLWASAPRGGYLSPSKFLEFAKTLKAPHRSLHPTEHGPRRRR